jgi:predicted RNA-binding protein with PUA-like domain
MTQKFWLMKTEPDSFGIADLARVTIEPWTGVRNYMARNIMRQMAVGDGVLFYHSSCEPPGVAGLARVVETGIVDETQFDPRSKYFDERATREKPQWDCVNVAYVETLPRFVELAELRATPALADMMCLRRGMRLSVQPVTPGEYKTIVKLGHKAPKAAKVAKVAKAAKPGRQAPSSGRRTKRT